MSRPGWMDKAHEFQENCNDYSMCQCGVPLYYHDQWEQRQVLIDAVQDAVVSTLNTGLARELEKRGIAIHWD